MLSKLFTSSTNISCRTFTTVRTRWAPSVTTNEPIKNMGPIKYTKVPADWFEARRVSPRYIVKQYEKTQIKHVLRNAVIEDFKAGDSISMQYSQNPKNLNDTPILIEGIVISRRNRGIGSTFTIINKFGEIGVERSYPLYSPLIKSLVVVQSRRVRRSKLYYLQDILNRDTKL